ncbi:Fukutin [Halotydeus destructor]|nr:Fukutin [Halotydeus destructor]
MWHRKTIWPLVIFSICFSTVGYLLVDSNYRQFSPIVSSPKYRYQPGIRLSEQHFDFLKNNFTAKFNIFIIEPSVLVKIISSADRAALIRHNLLPISATRENANVLSLGYQPEDKNIDLCSSLSDYQLRHWQCLSDSNKTPFYGNDFKHLPTHSDDVIDHYVLVNGDQIIHIAVFHAKDDYLWIDKLSDDIIEENLVFGTNQRHLYDRFSTDSVSIDFDHFPSLVVNIPSEAWYFMSQISTSTYASCNHKMAAARNVGREPTALSEQGLKGVVSLKHLTKELRINFWLAAGTLLGWYRECDVIPYTNDFDFATWSGYVEPQDGAAFRSRIERTLETCGDGMELLCTYGFPETAYEMAFMQNGVKSDLFFAYETENNYQYGGHLVDEGSYFYYMYDKWTLCSAILLGQKVLVPCDPEPVIRAEYGENWTEPVTSWHWAYSAHNIGPFIPWPEGTEGSYWLTSSLSKENTVQ